MTVLDRAFESVRLGRVQLRNRFIKAGAYEGMCPDGIPGDALLQHHLAIARGGVGMTTVAYCAVSADGRTFEQQMTMGPDVIEPLRRLTAAVHDAGAAASLQLGHCGSFSRNRRVTGGRPAGPSFRLNLYGALLGMPFSRSMTESDIMAVIQAHGDAAAGAAQAGFDAVELHLGHGYLLSQFISPATNRRNDRWGGDLEGRMRLPLEVVREVRHRLPAGFPILCKVNLRDGFPGGLEIDESIRVAQRLEREGVDALVLSGGFTSKSPFYLFRGAVPLRDMIDVEHNLAMKVALRLFGPFIMRSSPFHELYFLEDARRVRGAVSLPLGLLGGVVSASGVETAMREGFDFVVMGRGLIADPDFVDRVRRGELTRSRCDACNRCVAEMDRPGGVRCVCAVERTTGSGRV